MEISTEEQEKQDILKKYKALLRSCSGKMDASDRKLIRQAFDLALDAHKGVRRKSGEPYIFHPIEVAMIVSKEIGLGSLSIAAALIHDVVEDSDYTLEDIQRIFGDQMAKIIDGLTKISGIFDMEISMQAENFRKMLLTLSDDIRVILIKLADRLHNMRTMESMAPDKQLKIASETLYLYAPLAGRLGLYNIKIELEDLSLKYTEPEVYQDILDKLNESKSNDSRYLKTFVNQIKDALKQRTDLDLTLRERTKSIFSIRKKMLNQGIPFDEVYDKYAIRIIINCEPEFEKAYIWRVYSIITDYYRPNPERLRDWVSSPKANGYESLHTTVMGPEGHWVEVQIRSTRMDEVAEKGYAAHWKYKEDTSDDSKLEVLVNKIRELLENPESNAVDFVDEFKLNLFADEIFVFTPKGELKKIPQGSTPIDFAYEIHSDIGSSTLGAKVNGKLVPLSYKLRSGDQIEIITSEKQRPKENWLAYAVTPKAKSFIRNYLKAEKKQLLQKGKDTLVRKLGFIKIKANDKLFNDMLKFFELESHAELFEKFGSGVISNDDLKRFIREYNRGVMAYLRKRFTRQSDELKADVEPEDTQIKNILVFGKESQRMEYRLGRCCNPIVGDSVFGFRASNGTLTVHKTDCANALMMQSNFAQRIIKAQWTSETKSNFSVIIKISGIDTVGLVNKVTQIISNDLTVNIRSLSISANEGIFEGVITLLVQDKMHLSHVIDQIKKVEGVKKVERTIK